MKNSVERGFFGIGVFHPKSECNIGTLMRSAYCFNAAFVFTVGRRYKPQSSDTPQAWRHIPCYNYQDIADLKNHLPRDCPLVAVELSQQSLSLKNYVHFERACYLLGAEDHGIPTTNLNECHHTIQIPGLARCLNVATTGSIVMFDRFNKCKGF
jgi:tRNA G18 (ribose-2'-O)-methylase SpoU